MKEEGKGDEPLKLCLNDGLARCQRQGCRKTRGGGGGRRRGSRGNIHPTVMTPPVGLTQGGEEEEKGCMGLNPINMYNH